MADELPTGCVDVVEGAFSETVVGTFHSTDNAEKRRLRRLKVSDDGTFWPAAVNKMKLPRDTDTRCKASSECHQEASKQCYKSLTIGRNLRAGSQDAVNLAESCCRGECVFIH